MEDFIIIILLLIALIIILLILSKKIKNMKKYLITESFDNDDTYLYPTTTLGDICAKENLEPSFMPKACYVDGHFNSYANCKCEDKNGNCKICYDEIKQDSTNATVIFDANIPSSNS